MTTFSNDDSGDPETLPTEQSTPSPRADRITALLLVVLGTGVAFESWRMPRMSEFGANIWSAPGIVPGMVGLLIAIMGGVLYFRSREKPVSEASAPARNGGWRRVLTVFVLCVMFAGMLVGRIPFAIAAFAFIFVFILLFDREDRAIETGSKTFSPARIALAFGVAAAASFTITWVFEDIFLVRLP